MSRVHDRIFVSYSHADKKWLDQFLTYLKPYVRQGSVTVWSDTQIKTSQLWREEIERELASAGIALLLVSSDFMASDFIANKELPDILHAAETQGLRIFWVPIRPSAYETTFLKEIQSRPSPGTPLAAMPKAKREQVMVEICQELAQLSQSSASSSECDSNVPGAVVNPLSAR